MFYVSAFFTVLALFAPSPRVTPEADAGVGADTPATPPSVEDDIKGVDDAEKNLKKGECRAALGRVSSIKEEDLSEDYKRKKKVVQQGANVCISQENEDRTLREHKAKIVDELGCGAETTLCLRGDLSLFEDALPHLLRAGSQLTVRFVGCREAYAGASFSAEGKASPRIDALFREEVSGGTDEEAPRDDASVEPCSKREDIEVLHESAVEITRDVSMERMAITAARKASEDGIVAEKSHRYEVLVRHGRYYLDVGVLVPIVIGGDQRVVAQPIEQSPLDYGLAERRTLSVSAAIALQVFPFGRELGIHTSFYRRESCSEHSILEREQCRGRLRRQSLANLVGFEIAVDPNLKDFSKQYFGILLQPVTGLSISAGVALVSVEAIREGSSAGRIVDKDNFADFVVTERAPRAYFGVTFSSHILENIVGFKQKRNGG